MPIPQGGSYNITIYQGGVFSQSFQLLESDEVTPVPFPAGTIGYAEIRNKPGGDLLGSFTVVVTPATGTVVISLDSDQTTAILKNGVYDVFLVVPADPTNDQLFIQGTITLDKRVTIVA